MNLIGKDENGADAESWEGKGGTISVSKALDYLFLIISNWNFFANNI